MLASDGQFCFRTWTCSHWWSVIACSRVMQWCERVRKKYNAKFATCGLYYIPCVCSAISVIAWIGNVTAVTFAQWFTVSALREVSAPKTNGSGVNMLACATYGPYFQGRSVLRALKPILNMRISLCSWKVQTCNWDTEAVTRLETPQGVSDCRESRCERRNSL